MPRFSYSARDSSGRTVSGGQEAATRRDALRALQARGLQPLQLTEDGAVVRSGDSAAKSAVPVEFSRCERIDVLALHSIAPVADGAAILLEQYAFLAQWNQHGRGLLELHR